MAQENHFGIITEWNADTDLLNKLHTIKFTSVDNQKYKINIDAEVSFSILGSINPESRGKGFYLAKRGWKNGKPIVPYSEPIIYYTKAKVGKLSSEVEDYDNPFYFDMGNAVLYEAERVGWTKRFNNNLALNQSKGEITEIKNFEKPQPLDYHINREFDSIAGTITGRLKAVIGGVELLKELQVRSTYLQNRK